MKQKSNFKKIHNIFNCLEFIIYLSNYMIIKKLYHNLMGLFLCQRIQQNKSQSLRKSTTSL